MTLLDVMTFGDALTKARKMAELNQTELAEMIGVSQSQISKWENSSGYPDVGELRAIAEATEAEWLLDLRELPSRCIPIGADQAA